jgi:hypothetical protein
MKTKIQFRKLDARGFSHQIGMAAFAVVFAIVGVGYLVATHAASCTTPKPPAGPVLRTEGIVSAVSVPQNCQPVSTPASTPVSTQPPAAGEQLSIPPQRRPAQYVHRCSAPTVPEYVTQGTPVCLPGGTFKANYGPNVAGTVYSIPCRTTNSNTLRYAYISSSEVCPPGTALVVTKTAAGEQLSIPPQRRPVQYVHVCVSGNTTYVTQGTPNCLAGGTFRFNYDPSVPGTYYSIPCVTNSNSALRYAYISSSERCPTGTVLVSKN